MRKMVNLETFAEGGLAEKFNSELQKVIDNIHDPNTDYKKKRKIIIECTFHCTEDRELAVVDIMAKSKLAPSKEASTRIVIDTNSDNFVIASEYLKQIPGQQTMVIDQSTGEVLNDEPDLTGIKIIK